MILRITTLSINGFQHMTQHKRHSTLEYTERIILDMLCAFMLSVVMLSAIIPSVVLHCVVMPSTVVPIVVLLSVTMHMLMCHFA
jgi:hypothetical protein